MPRIGHQVRLSLSFAKSSADLRVFISRLQKHRFQLQKRAQELIRLDNVAFAVAFVGVNNPLSSAIFCSRATIPPRPASSTELVSDDLPSRSFGGMMPELPIPCNNLKRIVEIWPYP